MQFYSTNEGKNGKQVPLAQALLNGLADDGGLYMPLSLPKLSQEKIQSLSGKDYWEVAFEVLYLFFKDDIDQETFISLLKDAYTFAPRMEPLDEHTSLAWMDEGPTASFKDYAAALLARLLAHVKPQDTLLTVLVATSGDTGSAIGEAFKGVEGTQVFILYPKDEVSSVQKQHMDSIGDNVTALSIDGKFDDCQKLVKQAFVDEKLSELYLTSANSINIGRILPQIVYYFYTYVQLNTKDPVVFSIPSGNLGNSFGCELARRMGLPVEKIILAVNENNEVPELLETGEYIPLVPSRSCISNAMNVGNPSNLARYFEVYGGTVDKEGKVHKTPDIQEMNVHLISTSISDEQTKQTMKRIHDDTGIMIDPHGAVGIEALRHYRDLSDSTTPAVCIETAHPGKFPDVVEQAIGKTPVFPPSMTLQDSPSSIISLSSSYEDLQSFLLKRCVQ